eukprot:Gb_35308 [translate_table: standard]
MAIELKHKYTRRTGSKQKDDATLGVTDEDIAARAKSLKGMSLQANTGTPRDKSNHVSASSEETALHLEAINLKKQSREDSIDNTIRQVQERLPEDEASTDTQPTSDLATNDREEQPLWCMYEEDLTGDKGDTTSEDSETNKILKRPQTPFSTHKNTLYTKIFAMATQEKSSAIEGHPEGSKLHQPFRVNSRYLNARNSTGSPTPGGNPNPFNIFNGGSTSQMPTSPSFNPFVNSCPTSDIGQTYLFESQQAPMNQKTSSNSSGQTNQFGSPPVANPTARGGYNPMSFDMPQYENFGFNLGMPNFSYGIDNTSNSGNNGNNSNGGHGSNNSGHNGNNGNGSNNNSCNSNGGYGNGGNNNNGVNLNGSSASNGPSVVQITNTSLQHLKYEGYTNPSEHLALFRNNIEQRGIKNKIAIKQRFFSTLRDIALQWYECVKENSWPMIKEQFLDRF